MRPLSMMVSTYHIFNRTRKVFEELSRKENGFAPGSPANDFAETTGSVSEKDDVAAEV